MSCHNIERALNHVQEKILELYEEKRYDLDTTKKLLAQSMDALWCCDGNLAEASLYLNQKQEKNGLTPRPSTRLKSCQILMQATP